MSARLPAAALLLAAGAALGGCATPGKVEPGQATRAADHYRVATDIEWSRIHQRQLELWTVDGLQLQQLRFYRALEDGDTLLPEPRRVHVAPQDDRRPRYRDWMRAHDVMGLVADTLAQSGAVKIRTHGLEPADFGDLPGFRFALAFASPGGLDYRGVALGTIDTRSRLHLILYTGADPHYFDAYREEVDRILQSVELL